jgi:general secretion pathway protein A
MYQEFYGLREKPFELTANPKYLYLTPSHREALSNLQYGLSAAKAVTVLIGEAGTGKTTLLKAALASERCRQVRCITINNPALTRGEFIQVLARNLDLSPEAAGSKAVMLEELERLLREARSRGVITALVVDEAQSLSTDLLEEIRLLANIETTAEKLLPLVLAGQPDLGDRLEDPCLRQLKQRVALRCEITPFNLPETAAYIATRIQKAGGSAIRLFTREAVTRIYEYSGGIPRTISVLCDNALLHGLALGRQPVDQDIVLEVCRDFRFGERLPERPDGALVQASPRPDPRRGVDHTASDGERQGSDEAEEGEPAAARPRFSLFGGRRR